MQFLLRKCFLPLIFSSALFSQTIPSGRISGTIRDANSEDPIYFVNVFLANTTLGAASDERGVFRIDNIPHGSYDIVFSHIGYKAYIVPIEITFDKYIITDMDIQLESKVLEGEEIVIETEEPKEWRKNLERFTRIFLGETDNAKKCKIINPEVLDFQIDPQTDIIIASSESIIRIENKALGYHIEFILAEFEWLTDQIGSYTVYPFFKEMESENEKEYQRWIDNRCETYEGSLKHFLSSLVLNRVEENKFNIYDAESQHFSTTVSDGRISIVPFGLEPDSIQTTLIDSTHFIKRITHDGKVLVKYDDKYTSSLEFKNQYVDVDSFGCNLTPYALNVGGYWASLRIADTLPVNYRPDE